MVITYISRYTKSKLFGKNPLSNSITAFPQFIHHVHSISPFLLVFIGIFRSNRPIVRIWWFPKIGVPPNHQLCFRIFPYKPTIVGYPHSCPNLPRVCKRMVDDGKSMGKSQSNSWMMTGGSPSWRNGNLHSWSMMMIKVRICDDKNTGFHDG